MLHVYRCQIDLLQYEYVRFEREPTNESRQLVGGGGGQMEAGRTPNESRRLVGGGGGQMEGCRWRRKRRGRCGWRCRWKGCESPQRVAMTRWGSMWLASQVEGEREPPTSRNDSLGVVGAGVAGGGGESASNKS
jgi:hypothetical protein